MLHTHAFAVKPHTSKRWVSSLAICSSYRVTDSSSSLALAMACRLMAVACKCRLLTGHRPRTVCWLKLGERFGWKAALVGKERREERHVVLMTGLGALQHELQRGEEVVVAEQKRRHLWVMD